MRWLLKDPGKVITGYAITSNLGPLQLHGWCPKETQIKQIALLLRNLERDYLEDSESESSRLPRRKQDCCIPRPER